MGRVGPGVAEVNCALEAGLTGGFGRRTVVRGGGLALGAEGRSGRMGMRTLVLSTPIFCAGLLLGRGQRAVREGRKEPGSRGGP